MIALAGLGVLVFRRKSPEPLPAALPETPTELAVEPSRPPEEEISDSPGEPKPKAEP
jgi:hypothetical protein